MSFAAFRHVLPLAVVGGLVAALSAPIAAASEPFAVIVLREKTADGVVMGTIKVNGEIVGRSYENAEKAIPAGKYKGVLRTKFEQELRSRPWRQAGQVRGFPTGSGQCSRPHGYSLPCRQQEGPVGGMHYVRTGYDRLGDRR